MVFIVGEIEKAQFIPKYVDSSSISFIPAEMLVF